jgi:predicted DNA-binding antitoxin AbrB/MazE fold protein
MTHQIEAIYEGGVFRPVIPVDLPEHQRVTIHIPESRTEPTARSFDDAPTLKELACEQGVQPIADPSSVGGDFWPEDENIDDFIAAIRRWRQEQTE